MTEVREQKTEDRGRRSEVRVQKTEVKISDRDFNPRVDFDRCCSRFGDNGAY